MSFNLVTWKQSIVTQLKAFRTEMPAMGIHSLFGFLTTITLFPVVQAATQSGGSVEALLALAGGIGGNLIATELEKWRDRAEGKDITKEVVEALLPHLAQNEELRDELDSLWHHLQIHQTLRQTLPPNEAKEFRQGLEQERTLLIQGNYQALVSGTGNTVAQGDAVAMGERSIYIRKADTVIYQSPPDPTASDGNALRNAYLDYVFTQAGALPLELIDRRAGQEARQLALDAIYTVLLTTEGKSLRRDNPADTRWNMPSVLSPEEITEAVEALDAKSRYSAVEQLNRHRHLMLLGDPGSGKSTFTNFVSLCLAGEARAHPTINLAALMRPLPSEEGNDDFEDNNTSANTPSLPVWEHGVLLPVRVILRDFAMHGLPATAQAAGATDLLNFIRADLHQHGLKNFSPFLDKALLEGNAILLLDGLDEVPEAESRRVVLKAVIESVRAVFPKCRIVVTGRTYSYQNQEWHLAGFHVAVLAPFSALQIRHFVNVWYAHLAERRGEPAEQTQARADLLYRQIEASDRLSDMASRPILLTLMASIHAFRGGSLPEKRQELYAEAVDLLLDWWEERRVRRQPNGSFATILPSLSEYLNLRDKSQIRTLLERLAYEAHARQSEMRSTADIAEKDLVFGLYQLREGDVDTHHLIAYLRDRAGLLLPRGVGVYTFPHRTFQEYLAACYFTGPACPNQPEELAHAVRIEPERWREVALLAAAKGAGGSSASLWELVDCLCPTGVTEDAADLWGAIVAGQVLQENRAFLVSVGTRHQPKLSRVQQWQQAALRTTSLPPLERASAGNVLATLGDQRFDAARWYLPHDPLLGFVKIPAGTFTMGSNDKRDEQPIHQVALPRYWMARYPATVAQWQMYLQASGRHPEYAGSVQGVSNHPVVYVSWREALAYTAWLHEQVQQLARQQVRSSQQAPSMSAFWEGLANGYLRVVLPSEAEWERAARFTDGRPYPWGYAITPEHTNYIETNLGTTSPVGAFPQGRSPEGIEELGGNVREWTRSLYVNYPYYSDDGRENVHVDGLRVVRGGVFDDNDSYVRGACRSRDDPNYWHYYIGFRVCVSPFSL